MFEIRRRSAVCLLLIASSVSLRPLTAQESPASSEVRLLTSVHTVDTVYPVEGRPPHVPYVAFVGEPLILQVTLVNQTGSTIHVRSDSRGWPALLRIDFDSMSGKPSIQSTPYAVESLVNANTGGPSDPTSVGPNEVQRVQLRIQTTPLPDAYGVRVTLPESVLSSPPEAPSARLLTTGRTRVYVRAVESLADRLNVLYGSGVLARLAGRHVEARAILQKLVTTHPVSVPGWYELGRSWAQEGHCGEAAKAFARATQLVEKRADPDDHSAKRGTRGDYVREMKRLLAKCGA
jgi:hypothetical protein